MYETLESAFAFGDATGVDTAAGVRTTWDSKAMRKVNDDQNMIFVAETSALSTGAIVTTQGRALIKFH